MKSPNQRKTPNQAYREYLSAEGDGESLSFKDWLQKQKEDGLLDKILGVGDVIFGGGNSEQNQEDNAPPLPQEKAPIRIAGMRIGTLIVVSLVTAAAVTLIVRGIIKANKKGG